MIFFPSLSTLQHVVFSSGDFLPEQASLGAFIQFFFFDCSYLWRLTLNHILCMGVQVLPPGSLVLAEIRHQSGPSPPLHTTFPPHLFTTIPGLIRPGCVNFCCIFQGAFPPLPSVEAANSVSRDDLIFVETYLSPDVITITR